MRRAWVLTLKWLLSGWSWESLQSTLGKGTKCQSLKTIVEIDPGLEAYKRGQVVDIFYWPLRKDVWNKFTDEWNAQIVSKAATKLGKHIQKHIQKWKIKCISRHFPWQLYLRCNVISSWTACLSWCYGAPKTDLAMAQLLLFNCYAKCREEQ